MRIETNLGTIVIIGGVCFWLGASYGYHRTKEKFFTGVANVLSNELVKQSQDSKGE